jgi:hypothetical protein
MGHVNRKPLDLAWTSDTRQLAGIQIATGVSAWLDLLAARGAKGLAAPGRGRGRDLITRGWTSQLPNSLEARGRASETEPDRLGLATDRHWIHAASARASRASRARVSDSSQARSSRQLGPFARCWRRIGSGQRADYWPAPSTRGPERQRVPEVSCRGGFGVR